MVSLYIISIFLEIVVSDWNNSFISEDSLRFIVQVCAIWASKIIINQKKHTQNRIIKWAAAAKKLKQKQQHMQIMRARLYLASSRIILRALIASINSISAIPLRMYALSNQV